MVKRLKYEDFITQLDNFYNESKDKNSVYLTFKRLYEEKFKFKNNKKIRQQRNQDKKSQESQDGKFSVLVRAKLKKSRIQTILTENEIDKFHHNLMNVLTLYFIREDNKLKPKVKKMPIKKASKTQKRKLKRIRKIKQKESDKMPVDSEVIKK